MLASAVTPALALLQEVADLLQDLGASVLFTAALEAAAFDLQQDLGASVLLAAVAEALLQEAADLVQDLVAVGSLLVEAAADLEH